MGSMRKRTRTILIIAVTAATVIALVFLYNFITFKPGHHSSFYLETITFTASNKVDLADSGIEFDEALREELNQSRFTLVIEIEDPSIQWTFNYSYMYKAGDDLLHMDFEDEGVVAFEDWEYGTAYTFTIRFLCDSQNATVQALPFLTEDLYVRGTFIARDKRIDTVVFTVDEGTQYEERDVKWIIYFGELDENGYDISNLLIIGYNYQGMSVSS
jgi:hypothetical protein